MSLDGVKQPPGKPHLIERQVPLLFAVNGFEEQEPVLGKTIPEADERIFQDERAELRLRAAKLRLHVHAHACLPVQDDVETVGGGSFAHQMRLLKLDGYAGFLLFQPLAAPEIEGNSLPPRSAREDL
ncbi:MAG: hypothetical protein UY90_C0066G0002 [Candidatus Peregrinibacteria bacterium GW2011_GWA2_54_9]|nr:MAG: hypothetical protein UY90_C0066G0002 [Candidatus Peregrinibacteria bacterium GW2011_GWA2_54_9]